MLGPHIVLPFSACTWYVKFFLYCVVSYFCAGNIFKNGNPIVSNKCKIGEINRTIIIIFRYRSLTFWNSVTLLPTITLYCYESCIKQNIITSHGYKYRRDRSNRNSNNCNIEHLHYCTGITNMLWLPRTVFKHMIQFAKERQYSRW